MIKRAFLAALLWLPCASLPAQDAGAPTESQIAAMQKQAAILALGDHWSGLDRWALFQELEADDLKAAAARLRDAVKASDRPGALWLILGELASTDAFDPVRFQILELSRECAGRRQPDAARLARRDGDAQDEELACAHMHDKVLGDREAARACYERVLGEERVRRVRNGRDGDDKDLNDRERGAVRRLAELAEADRLAGTEDAP